MPNLFSLNYYKTRWFGLAVFLVLLLGFFIRFYNDEARFALAVDETRDAIIAQYALKDHKIPATGPFSSAGNFTTGNIWYIWLIGTTSIYPASFLTPWIAMSATYVLIVFLMILIGKEIIDRKFGLILGLLAAASPAQILQSSSLTNPSLVALFSALSIYFLVRYLKTAKNLFLFLFPFSIALAINTHFQAIYLLVLIPLTFIFKKPKLKGVFMAILGLVIPFIPYVLFDLENNRYNSRGIIDYLLYGQYKIYIPNRWLTYASVFFPQLWGKIIGGTNIAGYFLIILSGISITYSIFKRKINKEMALLIVSFLAIFFALRFYRGERFDGYFIFLHPLILILSAFACYVVYKLNKIFGLSIIIVILMLSLNANFETLVRNKGYINLQVNYWNRFLSEKYPGEKLELYGHYSTSESLSLPLALVMYQSNHLADGGHKVGFSNTEQKYVGRFKVITGNEMGFEFWDLNSSSSAELKASGWHSVNPSQVYKTSAEWYKK